jgi:hypothetical protein
MFEDFNMPTYKKKYLKARATKDFVKKTNEVGTPPVIWNLKF